MNIVYLKSNVTLEPLILKWYAWLHLISPLTAGAHFKKRYLKLMKSFVEHKELHQEASKNQKLMGGFFVNIENSQVPQAEALLEKMNKDLSHLINLSDKIQSLNKELEIMTGYSLEEKYKNLDESLAGAVELTYDIYNRANIRFIEKILYERFDTRNIESVLISKIDDPTKRPFILSTPRLKNDNEVELEIPFNDPVIDQLMLSREHGINFQELKLALKLSDHDLTSLEKMLDLEKPIIPNDREYTLDGVRIRYFGHACVLLQTRNTSILIDPLIGLNSSNNNNYSYIDLPAKIDAILITHSHQDHLCLETLLQIKHKTKKIIVPRNNGGFITDPSIRLMLEHIGFTSINTVDEFEELLIGDILIKGIPFLGEHGDLNIQSKLAYLISAENKSFLFAVDSNNIDSYLYKSIRQIVGRVDTVFIGMECKGAPYSWAYGPLCHNIIARDQDQSRRLSGSDSHKAWNIVTQLGAKEVYVYAMGLEPWLAYILGLSAATAKTPIDESNNLIERCIQNNIKAKRLFCKEEFIYNKELAIL